MSVQVYFEMHGAVWVDIRGLFCQRIINYGCVTKCTSEMGALFNLFYIKIAYGKNLQSH